MGRYSFDPQDRYRRRAMQRAMLVGMWLAALLALSGTGFWLGQLYARQQVESLTKEREALQEQHMSLQEELTRLRAEAQTANIRFDQLRTGYDEILPEGPMRELVLLLKSQVDKGIDAARLKSVIMAARPPQNCTEPQNKSFVVITPAYQGPDSKVSIEDAGVFISGKGQGARNEKGLEEAWFDPAKAVSIVFKSLDGQSEVKEGYLPMYHSVVREGREYRFTLAEGAQSFVKVTFDSCDYP